MSEAAKPLAVEDVLTSIRRLLAQDESAADLMGEPGDPGRGETQKTLENTLAALEAAMASRLAPVPRPDEPVVTSEGGEAEPDTSEADAAVSVENDASLEVVTPENEAAPDEAVQVEEIVAPAEPVLLSAVEPSPPPVTEVLPSSGEASPTPADLPEPAVAQVSAVPASADRDESPEIEEAPFIAIDMPDAPTPSFSFRHTAEVRRLQLVSPGGDEARKEVPPVEEAARPEPVAPEPEEVPAVAPVIAAAQPAVIVAEPEIPVPAPPAPPVQRADAPRTVIRRVERDVPRDEEEMPSLFDDSDDLPIDREVLRRLVGEVLREELQGALGQRMTRNVRKLVRAEIRRALLEQDQD